MSRIRWYHFYFFLAIFDVLVIMLSLQMHKSTLDSTEGLIAAAHELKEQAKQVQSAQQCIAQLNSPGNDLFSARGKEEFDLQSRRYKIAKANMRASLAGLDRIMSRGNEDAYRLWMKRVADLREKVRDMEFQAEHLFEVYKPLAASTLPNEDRESVLLTAGETMSKMDSLQHQALATLGSLAQQNVGYQTDLLDRHNADLEGRFLSERYVIALVILILVGVLAFGRRLHQADRALAEERRRVQEERRERLAAIGELCSSVAHGIRNPLAAIRSSAQLALELGKMDDDSSGRIRDILTEGRRLGDRVTGLLNMAKSNQDSFENSSLTDIVRLAARELKPELTKRGIRLVEEIDENEIRVMGDRRYLEQIVIELVSNAMEQSKPGDAVYVQCRAAGTDGMALVAVEDCGTGVPENIRSRVFDLFFTTKPSGTGIGLATVKRVARLHNGDVHVREGRTGGAKFEILLPALQTARGHAKRRRTEEAAV